MRVIAGSARGLRLAVPKGVAVRPTLDRVRESLFNILAPRLDEARFLDLFAGTGANGIEALSRGAAWCTFVDASPAVLRTVAANLETTALASRAELRRSDLPAGLRATSRPDQPYDILFADPPHAFDRHAELLTTLDETGLWSKEGTVIIEHPAKLDLSAAIGASRACVRRATYGRTALSFFA